MTYQMPFKPYRVRRNMVVYKKARLYDPTQPYHYWRRVIVVLKLTVGTLCRTNPETYPGLKNRANRATVLRYESVDTGKKIKLKDKQIVIAGWDVSFRYPIGRVVRPSRFAKNSIVCASGIHFYRSKHAARRHVL